ncbi:MAG TPA: succinic semialdehyde dehydrogenase [Rhodothermales bacterium]|nr:succinic semialdehyde dehydrogenase [Rhodothermales bacterium]
MLPALDTLSALASAPHATAMREVVAPFSDATIARVPEATEACVETALTRARSVQPDWAAWPVPARCAVAMRFHDLILEHREAICTLMQVESGKARRHALEEVLGVALVARYYARRAPALLRPKRRRGLFPVLTRTVEAPLPVGVVGVIAPWNYPFTIPLSDTVPALLAGNAVVLKPAETTPLTSLVGLALLQAAGLPDGVLQVVTGAGEVVGQALAEAADFVQFTGSTEVGRRVAAIAARRLVPASMELGGKNAAVVLEDAALGSTVEGLVRACFSNAGQLCISAERVLIQRSRYAEVRDAFVARTRSMRIGPGPGYDIEMGALVSREQLDKTHAHVEDARAKGARVLCGGRPLPALGPTFYAPTLLEGATPAMQLYEEETFGPVAALFPFDTDDEAVALANDTPYGLNASIWTSDAARGERLARRLRYGTVGLNDGYVATYGSTDAPMGGIKASGLGRRHGAHGLLKYTEAQTLAHQRFHGAGPTPYEPPEVFYPVLARAISALRVLP